MLTAAACKTFKWNFFYMYSLFCSSNFRQSIIFQVIEHFHYFFNLLRPLYIWFSKSIKWIWTRRVYCEIYIDQSFNNHKWKISKLDFFSVRFRLKVFVNKFCNPCCYTSWNACFSHVTASHASDSKLCKICLKKGFLIAPVNTNRNLDETCQRHVSQV